MKSIRVSMARIRSIEPVAANELEKMKRKVAQTPLTIIEDNFEEFFKLIGKEGCAFCPSTFSDGIYGKGTFEQAQLFALYFNPKTNRGKKGVSHHDIIERAEKYGILVWFAYYLFSHMLSNPQDESFCVAF